MKITNKNCDIAEKLLAEFLEGMPELAVNDPEIKKIIEDSYDGSVSKYIMESFGNFLDQTIEEN